MHIPVEHKGKNIVDVQKMNRSLVLQTIHKKRSTTRAEISKLTGLNKATVTNIVGDLINWGVVNEVGPAIGKSGRRTIVIELAREHYVIIGVWLTRRHFVVGLYDIYGKCKQQERFSIGLYSPLNDLLETMTKQINKAIKTCKKQVLLGVALALPGPYIKKEGRIALLTERKDWQNVEIVHKLSQSVKTPIITEHDTKAAVIAEWYYTVNYDEKESIICIMVGQGVGAGLIEGGKVVMGCLGVAGEIGHMSIDYNGPKCECGNYGCLEQYCSTLAIQKRVKKMLKNYPETECTEESTIADIIHAYKNNDYLACMVINDAARYLGYGIANVINLFNPGKVIIGDELAEAGLNFLKTVKENVKKRVVPEIFENMEISLSTLKYSVLTGVCMNLFQELVQTPEIFITEKNFFSTKVM